jgi:hypothetical protein
MATPRVTPKEMAEKTEKKILGLSIGDVLKLLIGGALSLAIAFAVYSWQAEKPRISWTVVSDAAHRSGNKTIQIANINIVNRGVKDAENLECIVKLPGSKIDDMEVTPDTIRYSKSLNDDTGTLTIPLLGENETVFISLMSSNIQESKVISYMATPFVTIRGKGLRVEEERLELPSPYIGSYLEWILYGPLGHAATIVCLLSVLFLAYWDVRTAHQRARTAAEAKQILSDIQRQLKEFKTILKKKNGPT